MKKSLFILFLGSINFINAQEAEFKIESDVFNNLSVDLQNKLLPFLTATVIETVETDNTISLEEKTLIKNWLVLHKELKIVKRSFYDSLSQDRKIAYNFPFQIIILDGEQLRYSDILKYEAL